MRKLLAIGAVGAALGYAVVYFAIGNKPAPEPQAEEAAAEPQPAQPVVLLQVVEVTNIDHLLDPQPVPPTGEPFEAPEKTFPVNAQPATPIPPTDD